MLTRRHLGTLALSGAVLARPALAAYPERTITVVVPFAPGGANDLAGRLLADRIGPLLSPEGRALVENRPGGGSAIGAEYVRRAKPDGYTLLVGSASTLAVAPASGASAARYHPTQDFTPITIVGTSPLGVVVPTNSGITTVKQLVDKLRAEPGLVGYASSGVGGVAHLAADYLANLAGTTAQHVPYRGGSQTAESLIKGETLYAVDQLGSVVGQVRDGALRLLAVTTRSRDPNFPDVPTVAEAVLPDYELTTWTVMAGPKDLPDDVAGALSKAANTALAEPRVRERLESTGTTPTLDSTPASTRAFLDREYALYRNIVQRIGLKLD
ncbi:Bug family tripartite tricarboxylate transporter substrate binding protein [Pararoseomonas indoligenes]|uniref:Tripartite tricarboxylate transporter substrate binding protein n=1 Tax=Roseomonas indoligenes TaxID=2820811 RepID=A0A940N4L5_9PROT|nr:tripartite tricarboxylate transporter substrate binding protein [Pararoseomonas indoligenes]MBP0495871.1 tripartite tricarboxylate transporter substrate binding protein [Pararoseomonas indoligenes]